MFSSSSPPPPPPPASTDAAVRGEGDLTSCLLSQYRFCAAGVGFGTAYALRYKQGIMPMVAAGAIGTSVDMIYGYLVECAHLREDKTSESSEPE